MAYDVAAYIWPAFTGDEKRTRMFWPQGIGEWQSVQNAVSKFPGHSWPRKPLWGYVNEADPRVMEMEIDAAADYGVNVFIYDWYWYDGRPFLENCLNDGYLGARNREKVKFYLMWANHDANHYWNIDLSESNGDEVIWRGAVNREEFDKITQRIISRYFKEPTYYKIDGKPVFMIYDLINLVEGLGGGEKTRQALDDFRKETVKAGFPGLHLQLAAWGKNNLNYSGVDKNGGKADVSFETLGFDSLTNYQFVHFLSPDQDYPDLLPQVKAEWKRLEETYSVPYFPHISVGWDNNPRFRNFRPGVMRQNTPENVAQGLRMAREYCDAHPGQPPLVTINSWNEWTETSYLQPDDLYGYGYLEAIRDVFVKGK